MNEQPTNNEPSEKSTLPSSEGSESSARPQRRSRGSTAGREASGGIDRPLPSPEEIAWRNRVEEDRWALYQERPYVDVVARAKLRVQHEEWLGKPVPEFTVIHTEEYTAIESHSHDDDLWLRLSGNFLPDRRLMIATEICDQLNRIEQQDLEEALIRKAKVKKNG